ncbi:MAG: hypothetical protein D6732_07975 [Methanobacteriota archaeon]|nr:MAG: hypothetical protein D6732_07975 [Euryarchaeota archaeon]
MKYVGYLVVDGHTGHEKTVRLLGLFMTKADALERVKEALDFPEGVPTHHILEVFGGKVIPITIGEPCDITLYFDNSELVKFFTSVD